MSERQARRPPVAPKPSFIRQQYDFATPGVSPLPSPALRGATLAFGPPAQKAPLPNVSASHNPSASAGALLAAASASSRKQQQQNAPPPPEAPPYPRGRALTTEKLPIAVVDRTSPSPARPAFRPHAPRSTSAVAAVAASAKTSPVRRPEARRDQGSYFVRREPSQLRGQGMNTNGSSEAAQSLHQSAAALAGAKASMVAAPAQVQTATGEKQRNYLSHLTLPSVQTSSTPTPPSFSGTSAAVAATRNAANEEARKRALSTSQESSPGAPVARYFSASPLPINGSPGSLVKVTPSQTDSDSDSGRSRYGPEPSPKPLPAPIPVRANRAAIAAQEASYGTSPNTPILRARPMMTASDLADAMVAGSVASHTVSRRASPTSKKAPPPIPRRRSHSVGAHLMRLPGMRSDAGSHTPKLKPLPVKPMRHTLRSSPDRDEPGDEKKRKHWRRHPNKHHEGDRRRWRDKVTERERKRYEGVWAANRGLLLDYDLDNFEIEHRKDGSPAADLVVNIVARDIWERSRLPGDVLEEIWDLVAQPDLKILNREEFVVGLWLIDQRLKGRKLPVKVSQSVWSSVRHTQGVKISSKQLQK
ncbi:Increased rDNA silencing protein [Cladophialophora chaetospira]|uniref:Increased rDNA silencing protein n=1 Tax=Cladophialophora chaetospira TaxID=386627 RepID=A0AA38X0D6_9EURO|nr:Increased rDNA silencing protein [Cladophialophora chaetospira]